MQMSHNKTLEDVYRTNVRTNTLPSPGTSGTLVLKEENGVQVWEDLDTASVNHHKEVSKYLIDHEYYKKDNNGDPILDANGEKQVEYPNHVYIMDLYAKQKALEQGKSHIGYTALDLKHVAGDGELTLSLAGPLTYVLKFDDSYGPAGDPNNNGAGAWALNSSSDLSYMSGQGKNQNIEAVEGLTLGCHRNEGSYVIRDSGQYIITYNNPNAGNPFKGINVEPIKRAKAIFHLYETRGWNYGAGYSKNLINGNILTIGAATDGVMYPTTSDYNGEYGGSYPSENRWSFQCAARVCLLPNVWPDQPRNVIMYTNTHYEVDGTIEGHFQHQLQSPPGPVTRTWWDEDISNQNDHTQDAAGGGRGHPADNAREKLEPQLTNPGDYSNVFAKIQELIDANMTDVKCDLMPLRLVDNVQIRKHLVVFNLNGHVGDHTDRFNRPEPIPDDPNHGPLVRVYNAGGGAAAPLPLPIKYRMRKYNPDGLNPVIEADEDTNRFGYGPTPDGKYAFPQGRRRTVDNYGTNNAIKSRSGDMYFFLESQVRRGDYVYNNPTSGTTTGVAPQVLQVSAANRTADLQLPNRLSGRTITDTQLAWLADWSQNAVTPSVVFNQGGMEIFLRQYHQNGRNEIFHYIKDNCNQLIKTTQESTQTNGSYYDLFKSEVKAETARYEVINGVGSRSVDADLVVKCMGASSAVPDLTEDNATSIHMALLRANETGVKLQLDSTPTGDATIVLNNTVGGSTSTLSLVEEGVRYDSNSIQVTLTKEDVEWIKTRPATLETIAQLQHQINYLVLRGNADNWGASDAFVITDNSTTDKYFPLYNTIYDAEINSSPGTSTAYLLNGKYYHMPTPDHSTALVNTYNNINANNTSFQLTQHQNYPGTYPG